MKTLKIIQIKRFLPFFFVMCSVCSSAQFLHDVSGRPYFAKSTEYYEGSPLLFQTWVKASVVIDNGTIYENMLVNVDLYQDMPIFLRDEKIYTFSNSINEFTVTDSTRKMTFKRGKLIDKDLPNVLMEIISDSPMLLKKQDRQLIEISVYGNGNKNYRYANGKAYYAVIANKVEKINLTKENAQKLFAQKWKLMEEHAQQTGSSFKTEEGWRKMTKYYSSVQ